MRTYLPIIAAAACIALASCQTDEAEEIRQNIEAETVVPAQSIKFNESDVDLEVGSTLKLYCMHGGSQVAIMPATWSSLDPRVATVSADGTVEVVGEGTTTVTMRGTFNGSPVTVSCKVHGYRTYIEQIILDDYTMKMQAGDTLTLNVRVFPTQASTEGLMWTSSDESVATVDANGLVEAIGSGLTEIKVTDTISGTSSSVIVMVEADCGCGSEEEPAQDTPSTPSTPSSQSSTTQSGTVIGYVSSSSYVQLTGTVIRGAQFQITMQNHTDRVVHIDDYTLTLHDSQTFYGGLSSIADVFSFSGFESIKPGTSEVYGIRLNMDVYGDISFTLRWHIDGESTIHESTFDLIKS